MTVFTEYATGTPCWVDVTTTDLDRTTSFYSDLFGWETEAMQEEAGGYTMFTKDGKRVAAASPPPPGSEAMPSHWTTYIASDDADATAARITESGGTVLMEPFDVFDSGRMAIAQDPGGAVFGIWQAREHHGAELANEPGSLSWNENQTRDPERAAKFYSDVFGYEIEEAQMGEGPPYRVLKVDGRGVAGMMAMTPQMADVPPNWSTTFAVEDTDAAAKRAEELGASVIVPPFDIPNVGRYAVVQDPVGVVFGIMAG
jgi:predicted enzyme related to lactoylglutathione lyase